MRKTALLPLAFLSVGAIAVGAGCANGNLATSGSTPAPIVQPSVACTNPPGSPNIQLVFPQNGSVAAPNLEGIVIAVAPSPLPTNWFFYSKSNQYGSTYGISDGVFSTPAPSTVTPTPTPLPVPSDTPLFPNAIFESSSNGIFAVSTAGAPNTVSIYVANASCYPGIGLGSFTTATVDTPTPTPTPTSTPT
jgi:hypothetical protein